MSDDGYNGWKNYETWAVGMYLDGNYTGQGTYELAIETTQDNLGGTHERYDVSHALRELIESAHEEACADGFVQDIFGASMSSVDWYELADAWIQNVREQVPA